MGKTLVIAEKPSVAQDIARALAVTTGQFDKHADYFENAQFIVTSAVGHLLEIQAPEEYDVKRGKWSFAHLPVIPPHFDIRPVEQTRARLTAVARLARRKDVTALINACDAGREGELIFRLIEQYAGAGKPLGKPVQRLWLQSMTPQAIRDGFSNLRSDAQMQGLHDAARSRSEADWLVGINGTRALTAFNSRDGGFFLTTVGRVQTPTLAIVVEREEKIRQFVSRDYWEVHASFVAEAGTYSGRWFDPDWRKGDDPEARADRLWDYGRALEIAEAVRGKAATVTEESKPATQVSPLLFDLTSLQREANARFGFSARTTLALAQALYEKHKALTYPRTDSRHLPQDYVSVTHKTFAMLAGSSMGHLAPFAQTAIDKGYIKPTRRVFDDSKVSDHFAIIPTLQAPGALSEAEQKLYDLVVRRFMAVFYPAAEFLVTTRTTQCMGHHFRSEGKVLTNPGWLAIYGREATHGPGEGRDSKEGRDGKDSKDKVLVAVGAHEMVRTEHAEARALHTRPPARYNEATLLGAMEGAGKLVDDEELREAMQEKGLGTPATRAAIIEGLIAEKYMLRDGRELIPTAKAFQLITLLHGLQIDDLSRPELTGEWEYKLAQIEQGRLSRAAFMRDIATMTERIVRKAKEYDRDNVPGNYATLATPCPTCGGVVRENYRRYACTGTGGADGAHGADGTSGDGAGAGCGFSISKIPGGRTFELPEVELLLQQHHIGPLDGFRSKAGWPFSAELRLMREDSSQPHKLEFDFGNKAAEDDSDQPADFSQSQRLGNCPSCGAGVYEHGSQYVCERAVATAQQPHTTCTFRTGTTVLQQPIDHTQLAKLLAEGKTDLLEHFISNKTRRPFKAHLAWDAHAGKVIFEFEARTGGRRGAGRRSTAATGTAPRAATSSATKKAGRTTAKSAGTAEKAARTAKTTTPKAPRSGNLRPSSELAAIIGPGPFGRGEVLKKLWDYIKAHQLQDPANKRTIVADATLRPVLGADRVDMFQLAGIVARHVGKPE